MRRCLDREVLRVEVSAWPEEGQQLAGPEDKGEEGEMIQYSAMEMIQAMLLRALHV